MTNLQQMIAIQDATKIVRVAKVEVANGAMSVWRILDHVEKHLDSNMRGLLGEDQDVAA